MRKCINCGVNIEDDALFCPYCGCVNKKGSKNKGIKIISSSTKIKNDNKSNEDGKKVLWILLWLLVFPIPITIVFLKSNKLNKSAKFLIIAAAWVIYLMIFAPGFGDSNTGNIKKLTFTRGDEVTVKVSCKKSPGYLIVDVKSKNSFKPEDVIFVSDNPEVATITFVKANDNFLYFEIIGLSGGETNVYAMSADGNIRSDSIHVIVTVPILIEKIELVEVKTEFILGETLKVEKKIYPSDAENKILKWSSSDESVATVDEAGNIVAVGGGKTTIKVTSSNGVEASFDITVDGTKKLMRVKVSHYRDDNNNIGNEWEYEFKIDGEYVSGQIVVTVGETLSLSAKITEEDEKPDVGTGSAFYKVKEEDLFNGFEVKFDVYVTENAGKNKGKSAHFIVVYTFSPK